MSKGKRVKVKPGDRFGRLTIIKEVTGRINKRRYFQCECDCGNIKTIRLDGLTRGKVVSCGCFNLERSVEANTKHGLCKDRIYKIWSGMKGRCLNKNNTFYKNYGGRGVTICEEWMDFKVFYKWAKENGYQDNLSIERQNVHGKYEPSNCTWIDMDAQKRNTTVTKRITFDGKTQTMRQWASDIGVHSSTLCRRFKSGMTIKQALTHKKHDRI